MDGWTNRQIVLQRSCSKTEKITNIYVYCIFTFIYGEKFYIIDAHKTERSLTRNKRIIPLNTFMFFFRRIIYRQTNERIIEQILTNQRNIHKKNKESDQRTSFIKYMLINKRTRHKKKLLLKQQPRNKRFLRTFDNVKMDRITKTSITANSPR